MKKFMLLVGVLFGFLLSFSFFKLSENEFEEKVNSFIGLTIDGRPTTTFPTKGSGYAIDSIVCDKGANVGL